MVSGGSSEGPSQSELDRTINMLIERQTRIDKRVERLETLEGTKWDDGRGCGSFEDFDIVANAATARVDVDPEFAENGDLIAAQAILFWQGTTTAPAVMTNLYMRVNNLAGANYFYASKYVKGGVVIPGPSLGAQNQGFIGRIGGFDTPDRGYSYGQVIVPFYSNNFSDHQLFGDWSGFETSAAVNARQEKGEYSNSVSGVGALIINRFDFFPAAGIFEDFIVYLYVWCPQLTAGFIPDD